MNAAHLSPTGQMLVTITHEEAVLPRAEPELVL